MASHSSYNIYSIGLDTNTTLSRLNIEPEFFEKKFLTFRKPIRISSYFFYVSTFDSRRPTFTLVLVTEENHLHQYSGSIKGITKQSE